MLKTVGNEYYYMVSGLTVPHYMVSDTLAEDIEYYVDWVARKAAMLERTIEVNTTSFTEHMEELYLLLCAIYAHWLEMEAARILRLIEINEYELCKMLVLPFISNLQTLAVDIQMAQTRGFESGYRKRNELECYRSLINGLKVLSSLIKIEDFEKAFDSAIRITELQESEYSNALMSGIVSKNVDKTLDLLTNITNVYTKKIEDIIDAATKTIVLKKILIVDDMSEMLTAITYMLKGHYQVFSFTSGAGALKFLEKRQSLDAFILDIDMPDMDGFELAKQIRNTHQYANTPILFLTGNSARETIMKSVLYGAKAFIVKPSNKDTIISKLSVCLN